MNEKHEVITVSCRNQYGIDENKTYCIDYGSYHTRLTNCFNGSKISYGSDFLKIGKCKIPIISHNVFGGSWCAEDFHIERRYLIKLFKHLKKTGRWSLEEATATFQYWWENKLLEYSKI